MHIGILALQGDFAAHARCLERLGLRPEKTKNDSEVPETGLLATAPRRVFSGTWRYVRTARDLHGLDGLILPGGESSTMLKLLEREPEFEQELAAFVRHHACLGTCAGAILLARQVEPAPQRSLGGLDIGVRRNAYGRQAESSIRRGCWHSPSGGAPLEMVLIRAPKFSYLGPGVEVLASESGDPVLVRQGRVLAATFHPELTADLRVHQAFLDLVAQRS